MNRLLFIFSIALFSTNLFGQNHDGPINWYTPEEAYQAYLKEPKPMFIDVYTDWCGWCKRMDQTTFQDQNIANYLNANFYPVKLDAETRETIEFNGKKYENSQFQYGTQLKDSLSNLVKLKKDSLNISKSKNDSLAADKLQNDIQVVQQQLNQLNRQLRKTSHDFARDLLRGQMSYPTFIFLFDSLKSNMPAKGFLQPNKLAPLMTFVAEDIYKSTRNVQEYQQLWDRAMSTPTNNLKWMNFNQALEAQKSNGKKLLIHINHPNVNKSRVMYAGTYEDPNVANYVNQNFNPVFLNFNDTTEITFNGTTYKNVNGVHQLAAVLMENKMQFPFLAIIDEKGNLVMKIPQFFVASEFQPVLEFIATDAYTQMQYPQWLKSRNQ
jgi:thioredoxin-related protein